MKPSLELKSVDTHLNEFVKYNVTHHDNIDGETQKHVHKHKHSKNGQEHDHNHEHTIVTQSENKLLNSSYKLSTLSTDIKSKNIYTDKILISTPHPFDIFRPPIS